MSVFGTRSPYVDIPSAPTLVSPITIVPGDRHVPSNSFLNNLHGMKAYQGKDIILDGNFTEALKLNDYTSKPYSSGFDERFDKATLIGEPFRFVNTAGTIIGSAIAANHGLDVVTDANNFEFYGLDANNPLLIRTANNGAQLSSRVGGSRYIIQNAVIDSPGTSGTTFNYAVGGSRFYQYVELSFVRVFNPGQEGICYIGATNSGYDKHIKVIVHDCFSYNSNREGTQTEHIPDLLLYNNTCILTGQETPPPGGQNGLIQLHDVNGYVLNSIYDDPSAAIATNIGTIFTHGTTVRNCYFRWNNGQYFVGISTSSYFAGSPRLNGKPVLFDSCIFHFDNVGNIASLCDFNETGCDYEFRNCVFSPNILAIFTDNRVGNFKNKIIGSLGTNGNKTATITPPGYLSANYNLYSDYLNHGLIDETTVPYSGSLSYYKRRMGYRTPRPEIITIGGDSFAAR